MGVCMQILKNSGPMLSYGTTDVGAPNIAKIKTACATILSTPGLDAQG